MSSRKTRTSPTRFRPTTAIAGFFNFSNRMANMAAVRPNAEFYTTGRRV